MKRHLLCLCLCLTALASGFGCASREKNAARKVSGPQPLPSGSFAEQWFNDLKLAKDPIDELYLREDVLFAYTKSDLVYAIGRSNGELRYLADPEHSGGVLRPPLLIGDLVLYPTGSTIDILNNHGRPVKVVTLDKPIRSGAVNIGETVYIGLDHGGGYGVLASIDIVKAYKPITWEMMTYGATSPTPAVFEKTIYEGAEDGKLYAVNEERGGVWPLAGGAFVTQGRFVSDIKVDDFGVYASNTDSKLYCLDRATGKIKWQYYAGVPLKNAPTVTAQIVYQFVPHTGIVALDKTTGDINRRPRWIAPEATQYLSEDDKLVYLRRKDGHIQAADKVTGKIQFESKSKFDVFAVNQKDALIYAATSAGRIVQIKPIVREGEVGNIVVDLRDEPIALVR